MDDGFGHWLAGFVDGEGSFFIVRAYERRNGRKEYPSPRFQISLRADDVGILRTIQQTLGYGHVNVYRPASLALTRPGSQISVRYTVARLADLVNVVEVFHRYPLRAKKRLQFLVWADAVHEMCKGRDRDNAVVQACADRLAALRVYVLPEALDAIADWNPAPLRHRRDYGVAPACLCGCGQLTRVLSTPNSVAHPDNPNYCGFVRGHNRRLIRGQSWVPA